MSHVTRGAALAAAVAFVAIAAACDLYGKPEEIAGSDAAVRVSVTDAPSAELGSATVSISRVTLTPRGDRGRPVELLADESSPRRLDLLLLRENVEALLAEGRVPPGAYDALHVVVDDARVELANERTFLDGTTTRVIAPDDPAGGEVRVRLAEPLLVESGQMTLVVVDFDVDKSFHVAGYPDDASLIGEVRFEPILVEKRRLEVPLG